MMKIIAGTSGLFMPRRSRNTESLKKAREKIREMAQMAKYNQIRADCFFELIKRKAITNAVNGFSNNIKTFSKKIIQEPMNTFWKLSKSAFIFIGAFAKFADIPGSLLV